MAILIKNPEVERKARELARRRGETITAALDKALDRALDEPHPAVPKRTVEEILDLTRRLSSRDVPDRPPVTREDFDALWDVETPPAAE